MKRPESFHPARLTVRKRHRDAVDRVSNPTDTGRVATSSRARVRAALGCAALVSVGVLGGVGARAAGAGGGDDVAPTLSGTTAVFNAKWKEGWLVPGAAVRVTGRIDGPATLTAILRRVAHPKPPQNNVQLTKNIARAGRFTWDVPLANSRALPGRYSLRITGTSGTADLEPVDLTLTLPSPPEGVVDRGEVGTTKNGPWYVYDIDHHMSPVLRGNYTMLYARFTFLSPPTGRRLKVEWKKQFHIVVGYKYKEYQDKIYTRARTLDGKPLPVGTWVVTLYVDGRVAKHGSVRIVS